MHLETNMRIFGHHLWQCAQTDLAGRQQNGTTLPLANIRAYAARQKIKRPDRPLYICPGLGSHVDQRLVQPRSAKASRHERKTGLGYPAVRHQPHEAHLGGAQNVEVETDVLQMLLRLYGQKFAARLVVNAVLQFQKLDGSARPCEADCRCSP